MHDVHDSLQALPVLVTVNHVRAGSVLRYIDGVLGWQSVSPDIGAPLRARVQLTDDVSQIVSGIPAVLLVDDAGVSAEVAKQFAAAGATAVCLWPSERDHLPDMVRGVLALATHEAGMSRLTVGGGSGGVGTTSVALTLGGVVAWQGRNTLVVVNDLSSRARAIDADALADPNLWDQATQVSGFENYRAVRVAEAGVLGQIRDPRIAHCMYDRGVFFDVDVLVIRPDRAGLHALQHTTASVVMVIGRGVVSEAKLKTRAGSRHLVAVEWSARVAHAVANERVPAGVPGRWLEPFKQVVRAGGS